MDPFLTLLHTFSLSLSAAELSSLKFLCQDKIRKRRLESVQSGIELFTILLEQQDITRYDVTYLEELFKNIKREDLVSQLKQFAEEGEVRAPGDQPDADEKRRQKEAIRVICNNVGRQWKMLMRELEFSDVHMDRIVAAHPFDLREQLVQSLREWQSRKGRDAKVTDLIKALRCCNLNLVADLVEQELARLDSGTR
ncbi:PREDICTED: FAS-associated death domain protein [Buceros rhinoceros silvestris]|uniref:FAS-associated death domain protein n=1 Tax=Buceros rhinoceros silvestris TaxID=175836 RepID=UPI00052813A7|nr:PREDICTED: FAS-associated death domain protein [Buceros rhinoceros silvestris]